VIHTGDCVTVMRTMESESIDAIVTDPPAGISFMSRNWDHDKGGRTEWVAWMTEVMRECYRLLKPGGYAVVWSLPRTCHWTAWAMEDAGFIIRDQLAHIFASGFPKGKAQLKPAREDWWLARKPGPLRPLAIDECRIGYQSDADKEAAAALQALRTKHPGGAPTYGGGKGMPPPVEVGVNNAGRWPSNVLLSDPELFDQPNPYVVGSGATATAGDGKDWSAGPVHGQDGVTGFVNQKPTGQHYGDSGGYSRFFIIPKADRADREPVLRGQVERTVDARMGLKNGGPGEPGKGSKEGYEYRPAVRANSHPTVKPTDLMRHLVRLVTPQGGTVLDCFAGSGSTLIAAEMEGFAWIGIEQDASYVAIAEARLNGTQRGMGLIA
jgi:hypothetical protein